MQRDYDVSPNQPAVAQTRCKWIIGDVTEVLDHNTWKLGKIAKMLKNNYFVIRLADCIQLKEFHISSLRVPLPHAPAAPHSKQFPAAEKATERIKRLPADHNFPCSKAGPGMGHQVYEGQGHCAKKSEAISLCPYTGVATNLKSSKLAPRGQMSSDVLLRRSGKKRKATAVESHQRRQKTTQPRKAARTSALNGVMADNCLYRSSQVREGTECSVASCSINNVEYFANDNQQCSVGCASSSPDDAMSACPCTSGRENNNIFSSESAIDIHELELEAYQSTVRALYASGPLTWEQESLLTNLRLSLNISNEEHLLQLRHLLSS